jgi:HK97 family phage prohead protease
MLLNFNSPIEAADGERRIVSGQIVPFGSIGNTSIGKVIFEAGSIQIPAPSKIKLLAQHNTNDPIGRAQSFRETATGIDGIFKLSAASKAQDYLVMASEGLIDGLSVGVEVLASRERKDGTVVVTAALLKEVSLVESPAFDQARVLEVVASETEEVSAPVEETVADENPNQPESEAAVSEDTTPATTEAAAAPAAEASRPTIKASAAYGDGTTRVRHGITSMGRYTEHKVKAALGDEQSKQWIAASEDKLTAAADSFSTNPAFSPIQYMSNFVSNTNFGRPAIDAVSKAALPASGMTINIPTLVTSAGGGSGTAPTVASTAESAAPSDTGMVSAYTSVSVNKYAGQQTISLELMERSDPIFFDQLAIQLERAYLQATDAALIAILTAQGTQASTAAASSAGLISYVSTESPAAYKGSSYFAQNLVANTDWWSALLGYTDTTGRPIYNAYNYMNNAGESKPGSIKGTVLGLDLYVDKNVTAGLVDESAFIIAPETVLWMESPEAFFSVNVVNSMSVQTAIYGYAAGKVLIPAGVRRFNLT